MFALILALRLLTPAGFMPAFQHGAVTIVTCPDAGPIAASPPHHAHGKSKAAAHQSCPYAAASSLGGLAPTLALVLLLLAFAVALRLGREGLPIRAPRSRERPPLRGPPIPA